MNEGARKKSVWLANGGRLFGYLLIFLALALITTGGFLFWNLFYLARQPSSIVQIGRERQLVYTIRGMSLAMLHNQNPERTSKFFKDLDRYFQEWRQVHDELLRAVNTQTLPLEIQEPLTKGVFPKYQGLAKAIYKTKFKYEDSNGNISLEELRPYFRDIQEHTELYLFYLDHLDLILANITNSGLISLRRTESSLVMLAGLILLTSTLWLYKPFQRHLPALSEQVNKLSKDLEQKNKQIGDLEHLINHKLKLALDISKTGTFVWKRANDELQWDNNLARMYGLTDAKQIRKHQDFIRFIWEEDLPKVWDHIQKTIEKEQDTIMFRIKAGEEVRWICSQTKVLDRKDLTLIGACRDETELMRRIERATELKELAETANRSRTEFLANISHDIRTPLSAILGFAELLMANGELSQKDQAHYLDMISKNCHILMSLFEDLLESSRIDSGKEKVSIKSFAIVSFLEEMQDNYAKWAKEKNLGLEMRLQDHLPMEYLGDPDLIRRVLGNLILNAIRYSDQGLIIIDVSLDQSSDITLPSYLRFRVVDQGKGIEAARQQLIFDPFSSKEHLKYGDLKSSGLGLYIARKLANLMGGQLILEWSELGKGSAFLFTVPIQLASPSDLLQAEANTLAYSQFSKLDLSDLTVLLVEDNPSMQLLTSRILNLVNIDPIIAESGEEALDKCSGDDFNLDSCDIVIMDMNLPGIDGVVTTQSLRQKGFKGSIIALSAHALAQEKERALQAGCNYYLTKPIQRDFLYQILQDFQRNKKLQT